MVLIIDFTSSIRQTWAGLIAKDCQELEVPVAIQSKVLRHISFHAAWQEPPRSLVVMTFRKDDLIARASL